MILPKDLTRDLKARLKSINGHIEGIVKMLDEDKSPKDILLQFSAADGGLKKAHHMLLDEVFRKTLAIQLVQALDSCPGDCGNEEKLEILRQKFPDMGLNDLSDQMNEVQALNKWLQEYLNAGKQD